MYKCGAIALGSVLSVVLCGTADADDFTNSTAAAFDLAALEPFVPITQSTIFDEDLRDALKQDKFRIEPASGASNLIDKFEYNLEKLDVSGYADYGPDVFWGHVKSIKWDVLGIYGVTAAFGFKNWNWGTAGFRFQSEGWFGTDTKYGGMDKLGHAYTGYMLTEYFSQRIAHEAPNPDGAIITGAALGMGVQTFIEIADGFSDPSDQKKVGHGFSYEDLIADGVGVGFSFLRNTVPGLANKLDFRLEYMRSEYSDWEPVTDYAGQKYVLALKLAGFEKLEDTPLRFVELQAGYFTQGYTDAERDHDVDPKREPYVAIGLNLNELLGEAPEVRDTLPGEMASRALEYLQVPYTYVPTATR